MILGMQSIKYVKSKTNGVCSMCGKEKSIICADFIPSWTRVENYIDNIIPLCNDCYLEKGMQFLELGKLKFLPKKYVYHLMRFYDFNSKYLKYYVRRFGPYRTRNLIDTNVSLQIMKSYDLFIEENYEEAMIHFYENGRY